MTWQRVIYSTPVPGKIYTVRYGDDEPFKAWFSDDRVWRRIDPDIDGDGLDELGPRLPDTQRLHFYVES